jgi:hypothetical protein
LGHRLKIMPITINGSGTVTGIIAGGLPDGCIVTADIADNNVTTAKIDNISVTEIKIADDNVTPAKLAQPLTLETAQSATGTEVDFTGIPSWVKRVTVMFANCSRSGSSATLIQLGDAGGFETTDYLGSGSLLSGASNSTSAFTSGFGLSLGGTGAIVYHGTVSVFLIDSNTWACSGVTGRSDGTITGVTAGSKTLSDTLTQIRITHVNGSDTFDAGTINIMYE